MVRLGKALFFYSCVLLFVAVLPAQTDHFLISEEPAPVFASPPSVVVLAPLPDVKLNIIHPPELDKFYNLFLAIELEETKTVDQPCVSCAQGTMTAAQVIGLATRIDAWTLYPARPVPLQRTASKVLNAFYVRPVNESEKIRQMWKEAFGGIDVWLPYYNVKKIEKWAKQKVSFKIFKMKCTPRFERGSFTYTCGRRF